MPQVPELGSCKVVRAGPDIQSHPASPRASDEMRLGLRRSAHGAPNARALHNMLKAAGGLRRCEPATEEPEGAAAHRDRECCAAGAAAAATASLAAVIARLVISQNADIWFLWRHFRGSREIQRTKHNRVA
jgi:hypothetical protein